MLWRKNDHPSKGYLLATTVSTATIKATTIATSATIIAITALPTDTAIDHHRSSKAIKRTITWRKLSRNITLHGFVIAWFTYINVILSEAVTVTV
jgi:hypothetical protein